MAQKFFNEGIHDELRRLVGNLTVSDLFLFTFSNNHTVADSDSYATFTARYGNTSAAIQLLNASWTYGGPAGSAETATYPTFDIVFDPYAGGDIIYGYVVFRVTGAGNVAIFGDNLPTPFAIPAAGGTLQFDVTYQHKQCP